MIDGLKFKNQLISANELLLENIEIVNALNVFPVPDGDTGTNMSLTMQDGIKKIVDLDTHSVGRVAEDFYTGVFNGAKGNSGVILSQFFRGFSEGLKSVEVLESRHLCNAFLLAKKFAYQGIVQPVEGTMLTVINDISNFCNSEGNEDIELVDLFKDISGLARDTVLRTPSLLPILEEAGVVDSGAYGLEIILNAMYKSAANLQIDFEHISYQGAKTPNQNLVSQQFLDKVEHEEYGYCTQLLLSGSDLKQEEIREQIIPLGQSAVIVGDENSLKIHIHAEDPGLVLSFAAKFGQLSAIDIANMDEQHSAFNRDNREDKIEVDSGSVSVISVVQGNGFRRVFIDLGTEEVIMCEDTMNPSVSDIDKAITEVVSNYVIILPNNKNVIPAAIQAAKFSDKDVRVIETLSMIQGISSMFSFDKNLNFNSSVELMSDSIIDAQYGQIAISERSAKSENFSVKEGEFVGFLNGELIITDKSIENVFDKLLKCLDVKDLELVTMYTGADFSHDESVELVDYLKCIWKNLDFEVVRGEQPNYHLIFSIE